PSSRSLSSERRTPRPCLSLRDGARGPAVPPCLDGASRLRPPHRLQPQPAAVTGGSRPRLLGARVAREPPLGRRLGEDLRRGRAPGSHRPRLARARLGTGYSFPSSPVPRLYRRGPGGLRLLGQPFAKRLVDWLA